MGGDAGVTLPDCCACRASHLRPAHKAPHLRGVLWCQPARRLGGGAGTVVTGTAVAAVPGWQDGPCRKGPGKPGSGDEADDGGGRRGIPEAHIKREVARCGHHAPRVEHANAQRNAASSANRVMAKQPPNRKAALTLQPASLAEPRQSPRQQSESAMRNAQAADRHVAATREAMLRSCCGGWSVSTCGCNFPFSSHRTPAHGAN